jgi:hypothetical protein
MSAAATHHAGRLPVDAKIAHFDPWIAAEPRFASTLRDVAARGLHRPYLVLVVSVALAGAIVGARLAAQPGHTASLTFRMQEGELVDSKVALRPPARIREFITEVALSRERLLELMERHRISDQLRRANPIEAVKAFRKDLSVEVARNYFLLDWDTSGQPRSAQIVVSYSGGDREVLRAVIHELGQIILETVSERRAARLAGARALSNAAEQRERDRLAALESRMARLLGRAPAQAAVPSEVYQELGAVGRDLSMALGRSALIGRRATSLDELQAAEQSDLGLTFRLVDERLRTTRAPLDAAGTVLWAAAALTLLAPLVTVLAGAFDQRIRRSADVLVQGFPLFGSVPAAAGDDAGSLIARRAARRGERPG